MFAMRWMDFWNRYIIIECWLMKCCFGCLNVFNNDLNADEIDKKIVNKLIAASSDVDGWTGGNEGFLVWHFATCLCSLLFDENLIGHRQKKIYFSILCLFDCFCFFFVINSICCFYFFVFARVWCHDKCIELWLNHDNVVCK